MTSKLEDAEQKWICEYCTYENWPSSLKCTMCRGAKPLLGEDIYRLRDPSPQKGLSNAVASGPVSQISPTDNFVSQNYSQNLPSAGKWTCGMCTYLNYQNATRCVQCGNRKTIINQSINSLASNLHEHLAPLRLAEGSPNSETNPQLNSSPINLHPERLYNIHSEKWSCHACTYENWPKATKCVMCGYPKEKDKRDKNIQGNVGIISSPERDHSQRSLSSPPHAPYIHQTQREDNLALGRRRVNYVFHILYIFYVNIK